MNAAIAALLARLDAAEDLSTRVPGAVLDASVARRVAVWMIAQALPVPEPAHAVLLDIIDLHLREDREGAVADAAWQAVRERAVLLGESDRSEVQQAGAIAEATAWSLSTARAGLTDLLMALGPVVRSHASANTGWTAQDEAEAEQALQGLVAEGFDRNRIPARFAERKPELSKRFVIQLNATNAAALGLFGAVREALYRFAAESAGDRGDAADPDPQMPADLGLRPTSGDAI